MQNILKQNFVYTYIMLKTKNSYRWNALLEIYGFNSEKHISRFLQRRSTHLEVSGDKLGSDKT